MVHHQLVELFSALYMQSEPMNHSKVYFRFRIGFDNQDARTDAPGLVPEALAPVELRSKPRSAGNASKQFRAGEAEQPLPLASKGTALWNTHQREQGCQQIAGNCRRKEKKKKKKQILDVDDSLLAVARCESSFLVLKL